MSEQVNYRFPYSVRPQRGWFGISGWQWWGGTTFCEGGIQRGWCRSYDTAVRRGRKAAMKARMQHDTVPGALAHVAMIVRLNDNLTPWEDPHISIRRVLEQYRFSKVVGDGVLAEMIETRLRDNNSLREDGR